MAHLSDHFTYRKIFRMTIAPILMMIFTSLYVVVDGLFIANFVGKDAYAGENLIFPIIMIIGGIGFMFGTGGSALSAKLLGEGKKEEANQVFSMLLVFTFLVGIIVSIGGYFLVETFAHGMASITEDATDEMVKEAITYGKILIIGQAIFMLQNYFQSFLLVDERSRLGFIATLCAGIGNIILDFLFIVVFKLGVAGAALGTISGYFVGAIIPFIHFIKNKNGLIEFKLTRFKARPILKSCFNGSSEFVNNISSSIVGIVFNIQLLKFMGQNGVAAYGTIAYVSFLFVSIFIGYSIGMAPVISFNYGAENHDELKNVLRKSLIIIFIMELFMVLISFTCARPLAMLFSSGNNDLEELTINALRICSLAFIFTGIGIFTSSFFTALNNGALSALNAFMRTLVFQIAFILLLPLIFGASGIWWAIIFADCAAFILAIACLIWKRKQYHY